MVGSLYSDNMSGPYVSEFMHVVFWTRTMLVQYRSQWYLPREMICTILDDCEFFIYRHSRMLTIIQ